MTDFRALEGEAMRLRSRGDHDGAIDADLQAAVRPNFTQDEFRRLLAGLAKSYEAVGKTRALDAIGMFIGNERAANQPTSHPLDRARSRLLLRDGAGAARFFEEGGYVAHAALQLERIGNDRAARVLWERLSREPRLLRDPYACGLVHFNLGRACARLGDAGAARKATVHAMHLLTSAADGFEAEGLRERAFDCYGVLLTIGKEGRFENLAEGYLNCARVLREDGLKYYVLQYYEDFLALAEQRGELHAAATLYREAAEYCRLQSLPYARHYRLRGAETSERAADLAAASEASPEMIENALVSAIDGFNDLGLYGKVRGVYGKLAALPLGDKRKGRYLRLAQRLGGVADEASEVTTFPEYLRMATAYPDVWVLDVVEWEQAGDPGETMLEVALDARWGEFQRRRALLAHLAHVGASDATPVEERQALTATHLGAVELYVCLAPLEKLLVEGSARVRQAVLRSVRKLYFKRSFVAIQRGLSDPDRAVQAEALKCVEQLHFVHALDPLSRIYRESTTPAVRTAALGSIAKVNRVEAVEILVEAVRHGEPDERAFAKTCLAQCEQPQAFEVVQKEALDASGRVRTDLEQVLRTMRR